jgi:hypothetical protein
MTRRVPSKQRVWLRGSGVGEKEAASWKPATRPRKASEPGEKAVEATESGRWAVAGSPGEWGLDSESALSAWELELVSASRLELGLAGQSATELARLR